MNKTIKFSAHEDVTDPGMDGVAFAFPFTVVDSKHIGLPEEESSTQNHQVIVFISRHSHTSWGLSDDDLPRVLFEYGKRFVSEAIAADSLPNDYSIRMPIITLLSHPGAFPFELSRLQRSNGATLQIEVKRKIGFKG